MMLREAAVALEEKQWVVNVRAAKDQLSSLLEQAAAGNEVIITSDGQPKAKLVPVRAARPAFRVDWGLLESLPAAPVGPAAEELIRADRDDRP
ncbi:MAG TPA: type II toxin-antitoxin system prevent-host-death family antitoxin [Methylomirabilota bacterium]|nr:type II toxin-antitoxin system prevent-host-death family antitoxin [Methylomirabilota bacterium]